MVARRARLERVSQLVRAEIDDRAPDRRGADLIGAKLQGADLRVASLRGAYLLGADLRGADLCAARLEESIFRTQPQVDAATGDAATALPPSLLRPRHWSTAAASTGLTTARKRQRHR